MNTTTSQARRYHWCSQQLLSFVEEPHTAVCGENQGEILNLTHKQTIPTQEAILSVATQNPGVLLKEIPHMSLPDYCDIKAKDVDLKRLGSILWLAQEKETNTFEELLLLNGLGPRTLQSLTLVSEVIHGTPSRFSDPARYAFAHGGKSGRPFPVLTKVYDKAIEVLKSSVEKAKLGDTDKGQAIKKLTLLAQKAEQNFGPANNIAELIEKENEEAWKYGGRTINGLSKKTR
jgi:hypothetical protein